MTQSMHFMRDDISSNYSNRDHYDLLIIGCGLTGLSSGLMWLNNTSGMKTLIVDKNHCPGGYSTTYERQGYAFETTQLFPDIMDRKFNNGNSLFAPNKV